MNSEEHKLKIQDESIAIRLTESEEMLFELISKIDHQIMNEQGDRFKALFLKDSSICIAGGWVRDKV